MNDAKAKAQQLASLGGVSLDKPFFISESSAVPYPNSISPIRSDTSAAPVTPISPGQMDITLNVQVNYSIK